MKNSYSLNQIIAESGRVSGNGTQTAMKSEGGQRISTGCPRVALGLPSGRPLVTHWLSTGCSRLDSLSIVSRQSDFAILRGKTARYAAMLFAVLVLSIGQMWGTNTTLVSGYTLPDLPSATLNLNKQNIVSPDANGYVIFEPFQLTIRANSGTYTWFSQNDGGSTGETFNASTPFSGHTYVKKGTGATGNNAATLQKTSKNYAVQFTGATEVLVYAKSSGKSAEAVLDLYEVVDGEIQTTRIEKQSCNNSATVLTIDELIPSKTYVAYIYGSDGSNGRLYGLAFKEAPRWYVKGGWNSWAATDSLTGDGNELSTTINIETIGSYEFKVYDAKEEEGDGWYGNSGKTGCNISNWTFESSGSNCTFFASETGNYTFTFNTSTKKLSITYPTTQNKFYYKNSNSWGTVAVYRFLTADHTKNNGWPATGWGIGDTETICGETYYYTYADPATTIIFTNGLADGTQQTGDMSTAAENANKYVDGTGSSWNALPKYSVSYNANGGSGFMSGHSDIICGATQTLTTNAFTRSGWTFTGWNTSKYGTGTAYADGADVTVDGNITLYAQWEKTIYLKSDLSWWYNDNAWFAVYCFDSSADSNNKWVKMSLAPCETDVYKVTIPGNSFDKLIFTRMNESKDALSWDSKDNQTADIVYPTTNDKYTITGQSEGKCTGSWDTYSDPSKTITFAANGGSGTMASITGICSGDNQTLPTCSFTAPTGYHFGTWTASTSVTVGGSSVTSGIADEATISSLTNSVTLTAQWIPNQYSVTHSFTNVSRSSGGTAGANAATYGTDYSVVIAAAANHVLPDAVTVTIGGETATKDTEYTYSEGTITISGSYILGNIEITASGVPVYSVTYNANGDGAGNATGTTGSVPTDATLYRNAASVSVKDNTGSLAKEDYYFAGWNTAANGSGTTYVPGQTFAMGSTNVVLYAQWEDADCPDGSAEATVFAADATIGSAQSFAASSTIAISSTQATITKGMMYAVNQQSSAVNLIAKQSSTTYFSMTNNNTFFKIVLACSLQEGDVITADGIDDGKGAERGIWVSSATSRPGSAPACAGTVTSAGQVINYTVTGSDEYHGKSVIYIYRATGNTTYFDNVVITRPVSCSAPTSPAISGTTAYTYGETISLTASATGTSASTTYEWWLGDPDKGGTKKQDASTSGATFSKASCEVADEGTYYCVISNGDGCDATVSQTISVSKAAMPAIGLATGAATSITATGATLPFTMSSTGGVESLTIKVYKNSDNSLVVTEEGINPATSGSRAVTGLSASTTYYYTITPIGDANHNDGLETGKSATFTTLEQTWTLSYSLGDGTEGTQSGGSAAGSYSAGATITAPAKGTLANGTKTFVGWSDGTTLYLPGQTFAITATTTLTAVWDGGGTTTTLSWFSTETPNSNSDNKPDSEGKYSFAYDNSAKTSTYAYTYTTSTTNNKGQGTGDSDYLLIDRSTNVNIYADNTTTSGTPSTFSNVTAISLKVKRHHSTKYAKLSMSVGGTAVVTDSSLINVTNSAFTTLSYTNLSTLSGKITIANGGPADGQSASSDHKFYVDDITITCGGASSGYTVSFADMEGFEGSSTLPANIVGVPSGKKIVKPADPTASGYTFGGWYADAACTSTFNWSGTITADKTIYAKWTALPASTTPVLPSLSNTEACAVGDFDTWDATPTNATTISAAGETVTYSWKNSSSVEEATTATYKPAAAGTYTVTVTVSKDGQRDASVTSDALTATLNTAASKTAEPTATIAAIEGESFTISGLTASNATGYQWYSCNSTGGDKSELSGKTSATLTDTKEDDGTYYYICTIGNACGDDIDSRVVTVNVYDKCFEATNLTKSGSWSDITELNTAISASTVNATISGGTITVTGLSTSGTKLSNNPTGGLVFDPGCEITVTLSGGSLQEGSIIQLGTYDANATSTVSGLAVSGNACTPATHTSTSKTPESMPQTYIVAAGDGVVGTNSFTISLAEGASKGYLKTLVVANCALCTPISPTLTYSTSTLYVDPAPTTATATLTGYYGTPTITYASSNTSVATVNETTGEVTAVAPGTATITATIGETTVSTTDYCGAVAEAEITVAGCGYQEIAKLVPTDASEGTLTNSVAATKVISGLQSQGSGWYKLGSEPSSFGITLTGGYQVGDSIIVRVKIGDLDPATGTGSQASAPVRFFGDAGTTAIWTSASAITAGKDTTIRFVVDATMAAAIATSKTIELYRTTDKADPRYSQNHQVYSMIVKRAICSDGLAEFTGDGADNYWSTPANWTGGKVPTIDDRVVISNNMTVNVTNAKAKEIVLDQAAGATLTIAANQALVVAGTIKKWNGSAMVATTASDLVVGSTAAGNGTLIFENDHNEATVQMYSKAAAPAGGTWTWQYIGVPFVGAVAENVYTNGYLYSYTDAGEWQAVQPKDVLTPFAGYTLSYTTAGNTFSMAGTLVPTTEQTITVPANKYKVIGNSWTAPIYVGAFVAGDFENIDQTVYLFNTGSDEKGTGSVGGDRYGAGTYVSIPVQSAAYTGDSLIAPLQGFFVENKTSSSGTLTLNYDRLVRPVGNRNVVAGPMHAPRLTDARPEVLKIWASGSRYDDRLVLLEREDFTTGYDDGWDGDKWDEPGVQPMLYTTREDGTRDAVAAIPSLDGTPITFLAGEDNTYTLRFDYDGGDLWLLDTYTGTYTLVETGATYTFTTDDKAAHTRFVLTRYRSPQVTTGVEDVPTDQVPSTKAVKFIEHDHLFILRAGVLYDATGKRVK